MLKHAFSQVDDVIADVRRTMVDVSGSPTLLKLLHEAQRALSMKQANPVLDVPTRFATTYYMLQSYIDTVYRPLCYATVKNWLDNYDVGVIDPDDHEVVSQFVVAAAPIADAISILEGEHYVTVALLVPLYLNCFNKLSAVNGAPRSVNDFRRQLQRALEEKFSYLVTEPNLPLIATMLHPAFAHCDFIEDAVYEQCVNELATWHEEWPLAVRQQLPPEPNGEPAPKRAKTVVLSVDKTEVATTMRKVRTAMRLVCDLSRPRHVTDNFDCVFSLNIARQRVSLMLVLSLR